MGKKIVLGMSGGVDSSVAALLLKKQGYEVVGFFMNCDVRGTSKLPSSIDWQEEEKALREICDRLGIELHVHDCEVGYGKKVIGKMVEDYGKGLTPNPDTLCNKIGKFPKMLKLAREVGAENIATGHYARVKKSDRGYELLRGADKEKDQSYFLCDLNQRILSKVIFPLGEMTKKEVREIARKNGFGNWNKRSSRGICYLGKIDVKKFLKSRIEEKKGEIFFEGEKVGTHPGAMFFTIVERVRDKGGFVLNKDFRKRFSGKLYVAAKERGNKILIAPEGHESLRTKCVFIKGFRLINPREKLETEGLKARIRHLGGLEGGVLRKVGDGGGARRRISEKTHERWVFEFAKGQEGVAAGQSIVFYRGDKMVASGEIRVK